MDTWGDSADKVGESCVGEYESIVHDPEGDRGDASNMFPGLSWSLGIRKRSRCDGGTPTCAHLATKQFNTTHQG